MMLSNNNGGASNNGNITSVSLLVSPTANSNNSRPTEFEDLVVTPGVVRYLKGQDILACPVGMRLAPYSLAILTTRRHAVYSKKAAAQTPPLSSLEGVQDRVIDRLIAVGINVDIIDAGTMFEDSSILPKSNYYLLLLKIPPKVLSTYGAELQLQQWLQTGMAREVRQILEASRGRSTTALSPADEIQVAEHLVSMKAGITRAWRKDIQAIFPLQNEEISKALLKFPYIGWRIWLRQSSSMPFLNQVKTYFGEKVAYYFSFLDWYNKALVPIAVLGIILVVARPYVGTIIYMRILVFWGFLVSVGWSFWFLKTWERRNNELNYRWEDCLHEKNMTYPNPDFVGTTPCVNPVTGKADSTYAAWKRYPKYAAAMVFMFIQILIMMAFIACWLTVFEVLKVRYPDSSFLSIQWFAVLGGGITFGLFVDIFQWNVIVSNAGRYFTKWENWKTMEQYEKSLIRKLFLMDFLSYYTWFFLLAFAYVIPGVGDAITNMLNTIGWKDPSNCCFGPYLNAFGTTCLSCPRPWNGKYEWGTSATECVPCTGWVTFDRSHLDLEQLFVTPIIVTQGLNLLLAVLLPFLKQIQQERSRRRIDLKVLESIKKKGARKIIAEMEYRDDSPLLANMSAARYLENDDEEVEALNAMARDVLFQSEQDDFDPYEDYHLACVQYGFVVMFSMLWPLMPAACLLINSLKMKSDVFRLSTSLKRPLPRKANGIGEWQKVLSVLGCTGVVVYCALVFVSTGAVEFFSDVCTNDIRAKLGGTLEHFRLGPDFSCFSLTERVVMLLIAEHIAFAFVWFFRQQVRSVPVWIEVEMLKKEYQFKSKLHSSNVKTRTTKDDSMQNHHHRRRASKRSSATTPVNAASGESEKKKSEKRHSQKRRSVPSVTTTANNLSSSEPVSGRAVLSPSRNRDGRRRSSMRTVPANTATSVTSPTHNNLGRGARDNHNGPSITTRSLARAWEDE